MHTVKQIITENWKLFLKKHVVLSYQKYEVEKMLNCSKNSCNSRICSSCGKRYADNWSNNLDLSSGPHKHLIFTVPSYLRPVLRDWNNLTILMKSSRDFLIHLI